MRTFGLTAAGLFSTAAVILASFGDSLAPPPDHPAIEYFNYLKRPLRDPVSLLERKLDQGSVWLRFENRAGYLRSLLAALDVPLESQLAVFSKTSLQLERISPENPRTIFFNDSVAVAWVRGGFIEIASVDPEQGVIFYMLEQQPAAKPQFIRRDDCQRCHSSEATLGVPGMVVRSRFTAPTGMPLLVLGGYNTDHRSPLEQRWGGWYVTGSTPMRHMGNFLVTDEDQPESALSSGVPIQSLEKKFDTGGYLSPYSDLAALMVFNHQMHMINLLTRFGWEVRAAEHDKPGSLDTVLRNGARELVDYLLFIEEAPLRGKMQSSSGFPEKFAARGPSDSSGRSLRQLDLQTRLLRYPCSYMIYSPQFDGLPARARAAVYRRLWEVLSGKEHAPAYSRLSADDRRAILEILKQTKSSFADYSQSLEH